MPICDELIENAYRTTNMERRDEILCQLVRLSEEESMGIFWQGSLLHVQQKWIRGWSYAVYRTNLYTMYFYTVGKALGTR